MLKYIVDFYCHEIHLAIEVDGDSHDNSKAVKYDTERQVQLEKWGVRFLRFDDIDIKTDMGWVVNEIVYHVNELKDIK